MSITCCCCAKRSSPFVLTDLYVLIISVSSTNANPVITKANYVRYDSASSPYPLSRIIVNKIALSLTHIVGPTLFSCPFPWFWGFVGKYVSIDIPNAVLILCVADCRMFVVKNATSWLSPILCNANDAIHRTMRL